MEIKLSDHFTYGRLFRFVIPSIIMMIFTSVYGVVDGMFVSNFVGKTEFAAVNLIMPFPMMLGAFGFMIGTGGSALVSMTLGQGKKKEANEIFSMLVKVTIAVGIIISVLGIIFTKEIAVAMGATKEMEKYCVMYGRVLLISLTAFMLQNVFQSFLVTAEKPKLGLFVTVAAGLTNVVMDFVFIVVLEGGVIGAALATGLSQVVGGIVPLIYFLRKNNSELKLCKSKFNLGALCKTCTNGSSELMTNISLSLVNMLYNRQLLRFAGEDGVAAYGVIMYVNFIFVALFIGYSIGTAPIIGYNYGAGNDAELKNVYKKSIRFNIVGGFIMTVAAILLSGPLSGIFVSYDRQLFEMTQKGFALYSVAFIFLGLNIYGSSFFTALGNGLISAVIAFSRTLIFEIIAILLLPELLGLNGVWLAFLCAQMMALLVTVTFFASMRRKYKY